MNAEHPVVQKEGFVLVLLQKGDGFLGHPIFDVLVGNVGVVIKVFELPRCHVAARRPGTGMVRNIDIETMLKRRVGLRTEMPFPKVTGRIAVVLEHLGQRVVVGAEPRDGIGNRRLAGSVVHWKPPSP